MRKRNIYHLVVIFGLFICFSLFLESNKDCFSDNCNIDEEKNKKIFDMEETLTLDPKIADNAQNYTIIDNNPYNWVDATGGTALSLGDDSASLQSLPFSFEFYNQTFSQVYVHSNGYLSFTSSSSDYTPELPSSSSIHHYLIAPFWDDLQPSSGGGGGTVYVRSFGSYWVAEWYNIAHYGGTLAGTFEVVLYENGEIVFNYDNFNQVYTGGYECGLNLGVDARFYTEYNGLSTSTQDFSLKFILGTHLPVLNSSLVSPKIANESDLLNFSILYSDADNEAPDEVNLILNGTKYPMEKQNPFDINFIDGCWYQKLLYLSYSPYNYSYFFNCSDGRDTNSTEVYNDIMINYTSSYQPELLNPSVSPNRGSNSTTYNFTVEYFDLDNNFPSLMNLTLNNSLTYRMQPADILDTNITDGKIYFCAIELDHGYYEYQINCSDGTNLNATQWTIGPEVNPFFGIPDINLINPSFGFTCFTGFINFSWNSLNLPFGPTNYSLQISNESDFSILLFEASNIQELPGVSNYSCDFISDSGLYYWRVRGKYGLFNSNFSDFSTFNLIYNEAPPKLTNGNVNPNLGDQFTNYNFTVCYTDLDNNTPYSVNVVINGTVYPMSKLHSGDTNYNDGCIYQYNMTLPLSDYNYTYFFTCDDGKFINTTQILYNLENFESNSHVPYLLNPTFSPSIGSNSTYYNFTVEYFDLDNNFPQILNITINNEGVFIMKRVDQSDYSPLDGILYYFNKTLDFGYYEFQINCSDGLYTNHTNWIIGPEVNPFYDLGSSTPFEDDFEDQTFIPDWSIVSGNIGINSDTSNSSIYSGYSYGGPSEIRSRIIDLEKCNSAILTLWVRQGGNFGGSENPDTNEDFAIEYYNKFGSWIQLELLLGSENAGTIYDNLVYQLPDDALHPNFRIRLRQIAGTSGDYDYWHFDDIKIYVPGTDFFALMSPNNNSILNSGWINFTWQNLEFPYGDLNYTLQLSNESDFSNIVLEANEINQKSEISYYYDYIDIISSTYYWRVRPVYKGLKGNWSESFIIIKDVFAPIIDIKEPVSESVYGPLAPYFELIIEEPNLNCTWYSLNGGTNYTFSGTTGTINQVAWDAFGNGTVLISFYANDSIGNLGLKEINVSKDVISPIISILLPSTEPLYGNETIGFEVSIDEPNLNNTWYSLNGGTNYTFSGTSGTINQTAWDTCGNGTVILRFYAEDMGENIAFDEIIVHKYTHFPNITIISPILYQIYTSSPSYQLQIEETRLNETWYTVDGGEKVFFTSLSGTINNTIWNNSKNGTMSIKFYANNTVGNTAYREITIFKNQRLVPKNAYAIVVGVSDYPGSSYDLNYCDDDANEIYNMLISEYNFRPQNIIMLKDSSATKNAIDNAFDQLGLQIKEDDVFFFYYSGHGGANIVNGGTYSSLIQSPHDYPNNYDRTWGIYHSNAAAIRVHFDRYEIEENYDVVLLGDSMISEGYYYQLITGYGTNLWSEWIPLDASNRLNIRMITDYSVNDWGFWIDSYEVQLYDGTQYLCPYDSIPSNPSNYYYDTHLDSRIDSLICNETYVIIDACHSGGMVTEGASSGRYFMTACYSDEYSIESPSLNNGVFTYFFLEALEEANDVNGDGVISMEECFSYVYSNTVSYSQSNYATHHPVQYDGISGDAIPYPVFEKVSLTFAEDTVYYSFYLYGTGLISTVNISLCAITPHITIESFDIMNTVPTSTGFGFYSGTIQMQSGYNVTCCEFEIEIEGNTIISLVNTYGDSDGDGLTDLYEIRHGGLNVTNSDTDSDGLEDGDEVNTYFTDPLDPFTDSDTLNDGDEVLIHGTDPNNADSDFDNLNDDDEIINHGTDPNNADSDFDGLDDGEELNTYGTDPLEPYSDSDNLDDGDEVNIYGTDPLDPDTDSDDLSDCVEVYTHGTDPLDEDSDNDGYDDGWEVAIGYDPLDPYDYPSDSNVDEDEDEDFYGSNGEDTVMSVIYVFLFIVGMIVLGFLKGYFDRNSKSSKNKTYIPKKTYQSPYNPYQKPSYPSNYSSSNSKPLPKDDDLDQTIKNYVMRGLPEPYPLNSIEGRKGLYYASLAKTKMLEGNVQEAFDSIFLALQAGVPEPVNTELRMFVLKHLEGPKKKSSLENKSSPQGKKNCPECHKYIDHDSIFCPHCGENITKPQKTIQLTEKQVDVIPKIKCPFCKMNVKKGDMFCPNCGYKIK